MAATLELETLHEAQQVLGLYDHYVDNLEWDELASILTDDFVITGPRGRFEGSGAAQEYEQLAGEHLPAHHIVNTIAEPVQGSQAIRAWSRYVLVDWEYSARVGDYLDVLRRDDSGLLLLASRYIVARGRGAKPVAEHVSFERFHALGA